METLSTQIDGYYEFEGVRFFPDQRCLLHINTNISLSLTPKQNSFLTLLIKKQGNLVPYSELKLKVWPGNSGEVDLDRNIKEIMHTLRKSLGKTAASKVETITRKGYRLKSAVAFKGDADSVQRIVTPEDFNYSGKKGELQETEAHESSDQLIARREDAFGLAPPLSMSSALCK